MAKLIYATLFIVIVLCGCVPNSKAELAPAYEGHMIERHVDKEAGVVCWVYTAPFRGGLFCIPISKTNLGEE